MGNSKIKNMLLIAIAILFAARCNELQLVAKPLQLIAKPLQLVTGVLQPRDKKKNTDCNILQRVAKYSASVSKAFQNKVKENVTSCKTQQPATNCNEVFADSLQAVATRLQVPATWLQNTMQAESGLQPDARNSIGATGLIQFLPATAISLGTTADELAGMSAVEQLEYVEKFYRPARGRINSETDLRLYTFFPLALNRPDTFVLQSGQLPAHVVAARNAHFDLNADMKITVKEFKTAIQ